MIDPCPRFGAKCIHQPATLPAGAQLDYSITSPIPADGILCKSNTPWPTPVATWTAGQSVTVQFQPGGSPHGGGHAQFSVSYDGGTTFVVVYEVLKYMFFNGPSNSGTPEVLSYTFTLPKDLPSSNNVIFAWSWVNAIGNREFYMNCADVAIKGTGSTSYTGYKIVIANHNGYPTIPEFDGNYSTGLQYYDTGEKVTVTGSGSTSSSNSNSSPAESSPQESTKVTLSEAEKDVMDPTIVGAPMPAKSGIPKSLLAEPTSTSYSDDASSDYVEDTPVSPKRCRYRVQKNRRRR
ncbi:hypothetical protein LPJ81_005921 [Coemansia sp. IMI 209127]|nr:hypothetical protein LPJ81_005921 [Coemansia sp. IMI 209127]